MGEEFADSPLQNRTYAIKNVGTGRYVALKGVGQEIYTVSTSSDNEARVRRSHQLKCYINWRFV